MQHAREQRPLSSNELSTFCAQISMILQAGISLQEGVSILMEDAAGQEGQAVYHAILSHLELGAPLHAALKETGCFPHYLVHMTEIGERSGKLEQVMHSLGAYYKREQAVASSIRSAVSYPLIMIGMMLLVIAVLIIKVLPIFDSVFAQLGGEMSPLSKALMSLGVAVGSYSWVFAALFALAAIGFFALRQSASLRAKLERLASRMPLTKGLYAKIASGRFASAMSLMLSSGLDMDESLDMVYRLIDNEYLRHKLTLCRDFIAQGASLPEALSRAEIFSGIYARMVSVGFKTGAGDSVMQDLAERYEQETDAQIGKLISVLEPTLVAILSIVVGMILLSVMLPLLGIMSSIG